MAKKSLKKLGDAALDMTKSGAVMGVGANVVGRSEFGASGQYAATGIGRMASFMPVTGTITGAGAALGALSGLQPKKKKKKY